MAKDTDIPAAKRTEREGPDPQSEPGEFADDMRVNRFEPPPDPPSREKRDEGGRPAKNDIGG